MSWVHAQKPRAVERMSIEITLTFAYKPWSYWLLEIFWVADVRWDPGPMTTKPDAACLLPCIACLSSDSFSFLPISNLPHHSVSNVYVCKPSQGSINVCWMNHMPIKGVSVPESPPEFLSPFQACVHLYWWNWARLAMENTMLSWLFSHQSSSPSLHLLLESLMWI